MTSTKRNETLEERISQSYASYVANRELYPPKTISVPASRVLQLGDTVELGNLADPVVVALHEEGEVVTVRYPAISRSATLPYMVSTWHWTQMLKKAELKPSHVVAESVLGGLTFSNGYLGALVRMMLLQGVSDTPDFQRGYVWTDTDKSNFLESFVEGRELGRFIFVRNAYPNGEIVFDGKQRLSTLVDFITSKLDYRGTYWHELSRLDRTILESRDVQSAMIRGEQVSRIDLLKIFLAVNAGGVPQTEEHLQYVRELLAKEQAKLG
jgi:hypothetical protein